MGGSSQVVPPQEPASCHNHFLLIIGFKAYGTAITYRRWIAIYRYFYHKYSTVRSIRTPHIGILMPRAYTENAQYRVVELFD